MNLLSTLEISHLFRCLNEQYAAVRTLIYTPCGSVNCRAITTGIVEFDLSVYFEDDIQTDDERQNSV